MYLFIYMYDIRYMMYEDIICGINNKKGGQSYILEVYSLHEVELKLVSIQIK